MVKLSLEQSCEEVVEFNFLCVQNFDCKPLLRPAPQSVFKIVFLLCARSLLDQDILNGGGVSIIKSFYIYRVPFVSKDSMLVKVPVMLKGETC